MIFIAFIAFQLTNTKSPAGQVAFSNSDISITIDYHRPSKKGRNIFGGLVPYGKYWRTGANNATEIEFSRDILFGSEKVKAGRYRLYTIPGEKNWTVVLNSELDKWGLFEPNYNLDVVRIEAESSQIQGIKEQFEILIKEDNEDTNLVLTWDQTRVEVPLLWSDPL